MTHPKDLSAQATDVPGGLKDAVQDLIAHSRGDGFLMELQTDDGQRYYLAFGKLDLMRSFLGSLPDETPSVH